MTTGRQFPDGIENQLKRIFASHAEGVFRSAIIAAHEDRMLAEEATADAFAEAAQTVWEMFLTWDDGKQLAWLRDRARKRVIDTWRKNRNTAVTGSLPEVAEPVLVEDRVIARDEVSRCWKVIRGMEPRRQRVAYLRWHEGLSITEAAAILGIDRTTASRDLAAVAERLRRELRRKLRVPDQQTTEAINKGQDDREEGA